MPPSSPTPYRHSSSLIPSSPITFTSGQFRRAHLRTSSTDTIIKGLSNWRRSAKSTSLTTSTTAPVRRRSNHDEQEIDHDSEGGDITIKAKSKSKSKSKSLGLGMGMRGTPAKIVKRSNKISLGATSTPIALKPRRDCNDDSTSKNGLSSAPLSSAEDLTSPSISDPATSPIRPPPIKHRDGKANTSINALTYDSLFSPSFEHQADPLFPHHQDLVIPLNDIPSSQSHRSTNSSEVTPRAIHPQSALKAGPTGTLENDRNGSSDDNDGWEMTIPLNDLSQPSSSAPRKRMRRSSSGSRKIKERKSTPRKLQGMETTPSISDSMESTSSQTKRNTHMGLGQRTSRENEGDSSLEIPRGTKADLNNPLLPPHHGPISTHTILSRRPHPIEGDEMESLFGIGNDALETISPPTQLNIHYGFDQNDGEVDQQQSIHSASSGISNPPRSTSRDINSSSGYSGGDQYGFGWLQEFVRGKMPRPYHPSPTVSIVLGPPSPSPVTFAATPSVSAASESDDTPISSPKRIKLSGTIKGRWKGAEVMKRIVEGIPPPSAEYESDAGQDVQNAGIIRRKRVKEDTPEISQESDEARQARIAHYIELAENYRLHVEYVLW